MNIFTLAISAASTDMSLEAHFHPVWVFVVIFIIPLQILFRVVQIKLERNYPDWFGRA